MSDGCTTEIYQRGNGYFTALALFMYTIAVAVEAVLILRPVVSQYKNEQMKSNLGILSDEKMTSRHKLPQIIH